MYYDTLQQRGHQRHRSVRKFVVSFLPLLYYKPSLTLLSYQQVQGFTALEASVRILPALVMAVITNVSTGYFVNRMPVIWVVLVSSGLSAISPLLMAVIDPQWPYWYMAFFAQVSRLVISTLLPGLHDSGLPSQSSAPFS
jgi:hypothetical protein